MKKYKKRKQCSCYKLFDAQKRKYLVLFIALTTYTVYKSIYSCSSTSVFNVGASENVSASSKAISDLVAKADEILQKCSDNNLNMEDKCIDLAAQLDVEFNSSRDLFQREVKEIKEMFTDIKSENEVLMIVKECLTCKICHINIPKEGELMFAKCCCQVLGCSNCVARWLEEEDTCPLCRGDDGAQNMVSFHGLDEVLKKLKSLA